MERTRRVKKRLGTKKSAEQEVREKANGAYLARLKENAEKRWEAKQKAQKDGAERLLGYSLKRSEEAKERERTRKRERKNRRNRVRASLKERAKKASFLSNVAPADRDHMFKEEEIETQETRMAKQEALSHPAQAPDVVYVPCRPYIPRSWKQYREWLEEGREPLFPLLLESEAYRLNNAVSMSKMSVELFCSVVNDIQKGTFRRVALRAAGVPSLTLTTWQLNARQVQQGLEAGDDVQKFTPLHLTCWHFFKAMEEAEGKARRAAEQIVFLMDPRFWLRFGPGRDRGEADPGWTERVEHVGKGGAKIGVLTIEDLITRSLPAPSEEKDEERDDSDHDEKSAAE